jgi:hypothetical protein
MMMDDDECGAIGGMIGRGNRRPQIPHDMTWARTRAVTMGSRRLTA